VIIRMWRQYLVEHQAVFEFLISDQTVKQRLRATEQTARDTGIRQLVTILRQGIDEGVFRSIDVQAVAEMMISAAIGLVEHEFATGQRREVDEAVETMSSVFLYGFSVEQAS
jgi:hypothetical protein